MNKQLLIIFLPIILYKIKIFSTVFKEDCCLHFLSSRTHYKGVNKTIFARWHLESGESGGKKGGKKAIEKILLGSRSYTRSGVLTRMYTRVCTLAYTMRPRAWECGESCNACVHVDRAACVRACMNARSSISDAYKCASSVSRPRAFTR